MNKEEGQALYRKVASTGLLLNLSDEELDSLRDSPSPTTPTASEQPSRSKTPPSTETPPQSSI